MKKLTAIRFVSFIASVVSIAALVFLKLVVKTDITMFIPFVVVLIAALIFVIVSYGNLINERNDEIEGHLSKAVTSIMTEASVGTLVYDEDFVVTWVSSMLEERDLNKKGEKVLTWLPELENIIKSGRGSEIVVINNDKYRVSKRDDSNTLLFTDITEEYDLRQKTVDDAYVLGLVSYDNYDEASESEEDISYINTNIKVPVVEYFKKFNIDYKTLKNNRLLLIMNEKQFQSLLNDRFSILSEVRKESKKADLLITLSMAFARGSNNLVELDELASELLEIAQTRGGDQVVSRVVGEEAVFYGGSSEAREKQSKVKVRVIASTLKDLINKSSKVIIAGHLDADADSIGASICMSKMVKAIHKEAYIIYKQNSVEPMIDETINKYRTELNEEHHFISDSEAYNLMDNDALVILVDHHSAAQSSAKLILPEAKKIVVVDHHRRGADLDIDPLLVYIEASASSTCELAVEFIPYFSRKNMLTSTEANIMYLGLIIDTNHFRNRTGSRTFEVAKILREAGADPMLCETLAQEPYEMIKKKAEIIDNAKMYTDGIVISALSEGTYPRSIASQACDSLVQTKDIKAAIVICNTTKEDVIVSARSSGDINVQRILEPLNGGGHMTAAGLQTKEKTVDQLKMEIELSIVDYLKKEN